MQHVDTGLCRVALALGYSFVSTVLMGIIINHYLLQLAEETGFEAKALASEEFLAATSIQDETVRGLDYNPTRLSGMFAKKFIRYFYDRSAREDHFEYWNQVHQHSPTSSVALRFAHHLTGILPVLLPTANAGHFRGGSLHTWACYLGSFQGMADHSSPTTSHAAS